MRTVRLALSVAGAAAVAAPALWIGSARADAPTRGDDRAPSEPPLVALGRRLFHDPAVSRDGRHACASCHDPEHGWSDARRVSDDDGGPTERHSQPVTDLAGSGFHWDGEFPLSRDLVVARVGDRDVASAAAAKRGLALATKQRVAGTGPSFGRGSYGFAPQVDAVTVAPAAPVAIPARLAADRRYAGSFAAAFGDAEITSARIVDAVDAFIGSLRTGRNALDRHLAGDQAALSPAARRGLALFEGKAGCATCHDTKPGADGRAPLTDRRFRNTGVAFRPAPAAESSEPQIETHAALPQSGGGQTLRVTTQNAQIRVAFRGAGFNGDLNGFGPGFDTGRARRSGDGKETGSFKTASLRDVARRAPFMHDGSLATLADVVRYYAGGGTANPHLDPAIKKLDLTDGDVADLVAFLESLSADERAGLLPARTEPRPARLRLVNPAGRPLAGVTVEIVPAGERLGARPLGAPVTVTSGADGVLAFEFPQSTHVHLRADGLQIAFDRPIPDTVGDLDVTAAATDRVFVELRGADLPERIAATVGDAPGSALHEAPGGKSFREFVLPEGLRTATPAAESFEFERVRTAEDGSAVYAARVVSTMRRALVRLAVPGGREFAATIDLSGGMSDAATVRPVERVAVAATAGAR